jgi:hypothetical protein
MRGSPNRTPGSRVRVGLLSSAPNYGGSSPTEGLRPKLTSTSVALRVPNGPDSAPGSGRGVAVSLILGSAETTNRRESLCLNAYLMNHWSRSSIRVCLAGVVSMVGCRAEMTTSSRWRPSVTEWPLAWRITRLMTCRPRQTLRHLEFLKQSIWRSEGCWAIPQSTRRAAESTVLRFDAPLFDTPDSTINFELTQALR